MTTKQYLKYSAVSVDNAYGTVVTVPLNRIGLVSRYTVQFVAGSLTGGTSPTWTISDTNPAISHFTLNADSDTLYDMDTDMNQEQSKLIDLYSPTGYSFYVDIADRDYETGAVNPASLFPSFNYNQNNLKITVPSLASLTSGSPTGSSGSKILITETDWVVPAKIPLVKVKKLQLNASLSIVGDNALSTFMSIDGLYKAIFLQSSASGTLSDSVVNYIKLSLNETSTLMDDYWTVLKQENAQEFRSLPDTGYAVMLFEKNNDASGLLPLIDQNVYKSVIVNFNALEAGSIKAVKVEYFPTVG